MEVEDDDFFPLAKLRVEVIDCGHRRGYIFDVLVDRIKVYDQSTIVLRELMKGFVSSPSFSG